MARDAPHCRTFLDLFKEVTHNVSIAPVYWDPMSHKLNEAPYEIYRRLRDEAPVYHNDRYGFYALSRFEDVFAARTQPQIFSSSHSVQFERLMDPSMPLNFLNDADPPDHTVIRRVVVREFTQNKIKRLEESMRRQCVALLDAVDLSEPFDFVEDFAGPYPFRVICELIGVDVEYHDELLRWWEEREVLLTQEREQPDLSGSTAIEEKIGRLLTEIAGERRRNPREDLMSELVRAEIEDVGGTRLLTMDEVGAYCRAFFVAGSATTTQALSWLVLLLSQNPDQLRRLVESPELSGNAFEEALRLEPPSPSGGRWLFEDIELHGTVMPKDSVVMLLTAAASRDDRIYQNPDAFQIDRKITRQLAFGTGIHLCLGAALARLEGRIAMEEILKRFSDWEIDEAAGVMRISSGLRGFFKLPFQARQPGRTLSLH
ncbi:MAG: cytochrome [Pseudonocardiales bacterium]|nr:cytochrome [Pseudonocardiales bacterium]